MISKQKRKKSKWDRYFLLSWKRLIIIFASWFLAVLLHNLVSMLLRIYSKGSLDEEAVFFTIATLIPLYFLICLVYSLVKIVKYR